MKNFAAASTRMSSSDSLLRVDAPFSEERMSIPDPDNVVHIHAVSEALKEIKTAHAEAVVMLLEAEARAATCGHPWCHDGKHYTVSEILQAQMLLARIRQRLSQRLFDEMDRVMKAVER